MKAQILVSYLLTASLVTFAQPSRKADGEKNRSTNSDRKSSVKQDERRTYPSDYRTNSKSSSSDRRSFSDRNDGRSEPRSKTTVIPERRPEPGREYHNNNVTYKSAHVGVFNFHHNSRPVIITNYRRHYEPLTVRRIKYPYRAPVRSQIIWSVSLFNDFRVFYPEVRVWRYPVGYRIESVSAYDARDYIGEVANVYGKVNDTYYDAGNDEYSLYFGDYFPYHDFSIVISGHEARRFGYHPENIFLNEHIAVTGLVASFEGKPEMEVRRADQLRLY